MTDRKGTDIHILKTIPLFSGLSGDQLKTLSGIAVRMSFKRGEIIFQDGDKGDGIYIVETGKIKAAAAPPEPGSPCIPPARGLPESE